MCNCSSMVDFAHIFHSTQDLIFGYHGSLVPPALFFTQDHNDHIMQKNNYLFPVSVRFVSDSSVTTFLGAGTVVTILKSNAKSTFPMFLNCPHTACFTTAICLLPRSWRYRRLSYRSRYRCYTVLIPLVEKCTKTNENRGYRGCTAVVPL